MIDMFVKKKAQISLESLIIFGVLIIGSLLFAVIYITNIQSKFNVESVESDEYSLENIGNAFYYNKDDQISSSDFGLNNTPLTRIYCGDGTCNDNENLFTCPADCAETYDMLYVFSDPNQSTFQPGHSFDVNVSIKSSDDSLILKSLEITGEDGFFTNECSYNGDYGYYFYNFDNFEKNEENNIYSISLKNFKCDTDGVYFFNFGVVSRNDPSKYFNKILNMRYKTKEFTYVYFAPPADLFTPYQYITSDDLLYFEPKILSNYGEDYTNSTKFEWSYSYFADYMYVLKKNEQAFYDYLMEKLGGVFYNDLTNYFEKEFQSYIMTNYKVEIENYILANRDSEVVKYFLEYYKFELYDFIINRYEAELNDYFDIVFRDERYNLQLISFFKIEHTNYLKNRVKDKFHVYLIENFNKEFHDFITGTSILEKLYKEFYNNHKSEFFIFLKNTLSDDSYMLFLEEIIGNDYIKMVNGEDYGFSFYDYLKTNYDSTFFDYLIKTYELEFNKYLNENFIEHSTNYFVESFKKSEQSQTVVAAPITNNLKGIWYPQNKLPTDVDFNVFFKATIKDPDATEDKIIIGEPISFKSSHIPFIFKIYNGEQKDVFIENVTPINDGVYSLKDRSGIDFNLHVSLGSVSQFFEEVICNWHIKKIEINENSSNLINITTDCVTPTLVDLRNQSTGEYLLYLEVKTEEKEFDYDIISKILKERDFEFWKKIHSEKDFERPIKIGLTDTKLIKFTIER